MRDLLKFTIFGLMIIVVFSGCKKYDDGPMLSLAFKKARVVNDWKMQSATQNGNSTTLFNGITIEFKKDNTYTLTWGANFPGTWDFDKKKEKIITTDNVGTVTQYTINRLTNKELWVTYTDANSNTIEYKLETYDYSN